METTKKAELSCWPVSRTELLFKREASLPLIAVIIHRVPCIVVPILVFTVLEANKFSTDSSSFHVSFSTSCSSPTAEHDTCVLTIGLSSQKKGYLSSTYLVFLTIIVPTSLLWISERTFSALVYFGQPFFFLMT